MLFSTMRGCLDECFRVMLGRSTVGVVYGWMWVLAIAHNVGRCARRARRT